MGFIDELTKHNALVTARELRLKDELSRYQLVGARITDVNLDVDHRGTPRTLQLTLDTGKVFSISAATGGCSSCDPDGKGWGILFC